MPKKPRAKRGSPKNVLRLPEHTTLQTYPDSHRQRMARMSSFSFRLWTEVTLASRIPLWLASRSGCRDQRLSRV